MELHERYGMLTISFLCLTVAFPASAGLMSAVDCTVQTRGGHLAGVAEVEKNIDVNLWKHYIYLYTLTVV